MYSAKKKTVPPMRYLLDAQVAERRFHPGEQPFDGICADIHTALHAGELTPPVVYGFPKIPESGRPSHSYDLWESVQIMLPGCTRSVITFWNVLLDMSGITTRNARPVSRRVGKCNSTPPKTTVSCPRVVRPPNPPRALFFFVKNVWSRMTAYSPGGPPNFSAPKFLTQWL